MRRLRQRNNVLSIQKHLAFLVIAAYSGWRPAISFQDEEGGGALRGFFR